MSETKEEARPRKIAAIVVADVVGYSRVAGRHRLHARLASEVRLLGEFPELRAYLACIPARTRRLESRRPSPA